MNERQLFTAALEQTDPIQRAAFLDEACRRDAAMRQRLNELLAAHAQEGDFLEEPAVPKADMPAESVPLPPLISERPGKRVGRYKLLENIGEGGCGVVFLAAQKEPVRRNVALKVIKPGMDTKSIIARFEAERQALAMMDHPNIAKVLDGGATESGRPYFVMELVRGVRITDYCDENNLSTEQRLALFTQVCHAIQHAHQKGIIHRDIKPSNVLVTVHDGLPTPKVIDFGIAKATGEKLTEKTLLTELHQIIGTPTYMSPEQAGLGGTDIDTRSDVYSLGVLLYELLTGRTPFDAQMLLRAGLDEMRRVIREQEPPKPSTRLSRLSDADLTDVGAHRQLDPAKLAGVLRGDLDSIAMKCLEKDRVRRYETADSLALDVQRYLAHEPVLAGPPSAGYRLRKFVRRNRGPVTAAAVIAVLVVLTFAGLVVGIVLVNEERERTLAALGRETVALERETAERHLKETALTAETRAKERTVEALRKMTDEVVQKLLGKQEQFGEHEKRFLRDVQQMYEEFTREQGETPTARALRAEGYTRVAGIRRTFGERVEAERDMGRALALLEKLSAEFPKAFEYRLYLADAYYKRGILLDELDKPTEAQAALVRGIAISERLHTERPADFECRHMLAKSRGELGVILRNAGKPKEADVEFRRSIAILTELTTQFPAQSIYKDTLTDTLNHYGFALHVWGRHQDAADAHRQVIAIEQRLVDQFPGVPQYRHVLAGAHDKLGAALREVGMYAEAKAEHDRAIQIYQELAAKFPAVPGYRVSLAGGYINVAHVALRKGDPQESLETYSKGIQLLDVVMAQAPGHASSRRYSNNAFEGRAQAYEQLGRYGDAARDWERAVTFEEQTKATNSLLRQISALARSGQTEKAVAIAKDVTPNDQASDIWLWEAAHALARAAPDAPTDATAIRLQAKRFARQAVASAQHQYAPDSLELESALRDVAEFLFREGDFSEAEPVFRDLVKARARRMPNESLDATKTASLARLLSDWAYADRTSEDNAKAAERARESLNLLRQCVAMRTESAKPGDWRLADTESRLGFALVAVAATDGSLSPDARKQHLSEAEPLILHSEAMLRQSPRVESKYRRDALVRVVKLYEFWNDVAPGSGKAEQAANARKKLLEFDNPDRGKLKAPEPDA